MARVVSEKAVMARINRKNRQVAIRKSRESSQWYHTTGRYYLVDVEKNHMLDYHVDLEEYARSVNALREDETLRVRSSV